MSNKTKRKLSKKFVKKYKVAKEYMLDDIIYDPNDKDEVRDASQYVGKYILKRMGFGAKRKCQAGAIKINTKLKNKEFNVDEVYPEMDKFQISVLTQSLISCPFGDMPKSGWGNQSKNIEEFIFNMPDIIGTELLNIAWDINGLSENERSK